MDSSEAAMKENFTAKLTKLIGTKCSNNGFITKEKYTQLIKNIFELKLKTTGKTPADYQRLKRYDVIKVGNCNKLIYPLQENNQTIKYYVCTEEIFETIHQTHLAIGHGGRNRMMLELQQKYKNITAECVMIYLNLCEACQKKSKMMKKNAPVKPMLLNEIDSKCQVDLIEMQTHQDYNYILVYQDHSTKFILLRPLKSKQGAEIASVLLDIFTIFGAPVILQYHDGPRVIEELSSIWEELKMVNGKTQDSLGAQQDIKSMLDAWLELNPTRNWIEGLRFIQLMKNRTYHQELKCTPFEAMFGAPIRIGLNSSWLPKAIKDEEELGKVVKQFKNEVKQEELNDDDCGEIAGSFDDSSIKIENDSILEEKMELEEDMENSEALQAVKRDIVARSKTRINRKRKLKRQIQNDIQ